MDVTDIPLTDDQIREFLMRPAISPAIIAKSAGLSRQYLHHFVRGRIKTLRGERRLAICRAIIDAAFLADPDTASMRVQDLWLQQVHS